MEFASPPLSVLDLSVVTEGGTSAVARANTTVLDLLDRLCSHHHDLKTIDNWALVDGRGKRAFVPPDDPRHPGQPARAA